MDIFNQIFKDLVFTIVDEKQGYTIYGAGLASGLGGGTRRYVLLFVPNHLAIKKQARIHELAWQNLQTRQLSYSYKLKQQYWSPPREDDIILGITSRSKTSSMYSCVDPNVSFPFEILLLHDPKKKSSLQYRDKLTLLSAINMFNSVFNYTGQISPLVYTSGPNQTPPLANPIPPQNQFIQKIKSIPEIPSIQNWFGSSGVLPNTRGSSSSYQQNEVTDDSFDIL